MQTIVAPELLQLLSLGVLDPDTHPDLADQPADERDTYRDPYLRPGRYLRWLPNPVLGFPRRGFVLRRRPSPPWPWSKRTDLAEAAVADGRQQLAALWLPAAGMSTDIAGRGARIIRPGEELSPGDVAQIDGAGLMVEFLNGQHPPRPDPAAWVALRVRGEPDATLSATAWAAGRSQGEDTVMSEVTGQLGDLDPWQPHGSDGDRVLLLHGGLVDSIELHANGPANLVGMSWLITELYAFDTSHSTAQTRWEDVGRFFLPIDGDGVSYPSQPDADAVAEQRLAAFAPRARSPWADPDWPPTPVAANDMAADLAARHLGDQLTQMRDLLAAVLKAEVAEARPQGTVRLDPSVASDVDVGPDGQVHYDITNGDGSASNLDETATADVPAVPLLLAGTLDAPLAHLLGVATVDRDAPEQVPYDYVVSAVYPSLWLLTLLAPNMQDLLGEESPLAQAAQYGVELPIVPPLPPDDLDENSMFVRAASVATMVLPATPPPVPPPEDVKVETVVVPGREPVPAEALVTWRSQAAAGFDRAPVVGATAERHDADGFKSLARTDPIYGHELPWLFGEGEHLVRDDGLRVQGPTGWYVRNLDLWGRWSMGAKITADLDIRVPPPPPSGVVASLHGMIDDDAEVVEQVVVAFDWTAGHDAMAPQLAGFDVALAAGDVGEDGWDDVDGSGGGTLARIKPDGSEVDPQGTVSVTSLDDGGIRIEVVLPKAPAAANGYRRETTAVVRAVAADEELSRPAGALAEIVDAAPPDPPAGLPGVQLTSWPDADGLGWWTCRWNASPDDRVQVLRVSGTRLLAAAGKDRSDLLAAGDLDDQAAFLRQLAAEVHAADDALPPGAQAGGPKHAHAFSPDHPGSYRYPDDASHTMSVDGSSQDLTVVVALATGPTGTRAPWPEDPDAFTVLAARRLDPLVPPRVVARTSHEPDGSVAVSVEAVGAVSRVRLWRTSDPALVGDPRRMRPLPPMTLVDGEASFADGPLAAGTWHAYLAVAESADRRWSVPTEPVWVHVPVSD